MIENNISLDVLFYIIKGESSSQSLPHWPGPGRIRLMKKIHLIGEFQIVETLLKELVL